MSDQIVSLFEKYLANSASEAEKSELDGWIARNEELRSWLDCQLADSPQYMDAALQQKILENIHQLLVQQQKKKRLRLPFWTRYVAAAALVLLLIGSLAIIWRNDSKSVLYTEVEAIRGQKSTVTLPDGTKVILNSESKIRYGTDFSKPKRRVELTGEAYFYVATDKDKPFVVHAGEVSVKALGTSFNVRAYPEENSISTTLTEGRVELETPCEKKSLQPNQRLEYDSGSKQTALIELNDAQQSVGWLNDQLSFENATLAELAGNLSRTYNVEITFSPESIKEQRFTGCIRNNSLQSVLRILSLTSPIRYEIQEQKIILYEVPGESKLFKKP